MFLERSSYQLVTMVLLCAALSSCMVGPNFHSPAAPNTRSYTKKPIPIKTVSAPTAGKAGHAQHFIYGQDIPAQWWHLYHSPDLNSLIQQGLANSPNLIAAKATLRQAQENYNAQFGASMLPSVNGNLSGERQRFSGAEFGATNNRSLFNLFNVGVNVSYTLDIFGALRRQLEALGAQIDYSQYELDAAYITLTSNIVTTAVTQASLRAQIEATKDIIKAQSHILAILKKQVKLGGAAGVDALTQQTQLEQTIATLPPLEQSFAQTQHALSVLVGQLPSEGHLPDFRLDKIHLPTLLPVSLPSVLVRQRPDIQASEALLHAACAQVGVAEANLFPQVTLTGAYGWTNLTLANIFAANNKIWNITGNILQPIYAGGSLMAKKRAAEAGFQLAAAQYRQTVLQAFQNVADTLRALEHDAQLLRAQKAAEVTARDALRITERQYRAGGVAYLSLLNAQRQYQQTRINRIQAQAARYNDTAALFQALGGGWWNDRSLVTNG